MAGGANSSSLVGPVVTLRVLARQVMQAGKQLLLAAALLSQFTDFVPVVWDFVGAIWDSVGVIWDYMDFIGDIWSSYERASRLCVRSFDFCSDREGLAGFLARHCIPSFLDTGAPIEGFWLGPGP